VIIGKHYPSDAIVGLAVGLGVVIVLRALFALRGIRLQPQGETKQ
jgi:membrane-associated phospholipid phosphatase